MELSLHDRLWAAVAGYEAQYGEKSIGEQHPGLPSGAVERIEAVVNAATAIVRSELHQGFTLVVAQLDSSYITIWADPEKAQSFADSYKEAGVEVELVKNVQVERGVL